MTPEIKSDLETLRKAKPYIRGILTFILGLTSPHSSQSEDYATADKFIRQLEEDIKKNG